MNFINAQPLTKGVAHVGHAGSRRGVARWGATVGGRKRNTLSSRQQVDETTPPAVRLSKN